MQKIIRRLFYVWVALTVSGTYLLEPAYGDAATQPQTQTIPVDDEPQEEPPDLVGWMEISGSLREGPAPYAWVAPDDMGLTLERVIRQINHVSDHDRYAGLVIYLDEANISLAQVYEIRQAIRHARAAGKKILIFAQQYDLLSYLLACSADQVLLQRKGVVLLTGLNLEELYLAGLLEKLGVKADFLQIGRFKGAQEPLTRTQPSEAWNQNIDPLLTDLYDLILEKIAADRGIDRPQIEQLLIDCWSLSDEQYIQRGLIDQLTQRDLVKATNAQFGDDFEWDDLLADAGPNPNRDNPFALFRMLFQEPSVQINRPSLAVINAAGPITGGESRIENAFGGKSIGSSTLVHVLHDAKENDQIRGVLLRIDSPGGSALASEVIWQALRDLAQTKPLYVSIGSTAASGGYYLACAGHQIYVTPGSLLGSIGVVGGKITLGGLYEKIGITVYRRSRGPLGDMFNSVEPFTPQQHAALKQAFKRTYNLFTDRVLAGRGQRVADINAVAQGRVFSGRQAVDNGLADKIGGFKTALNDLAQEAGLEPGRYDIIHLPAPQSLTEYFEKLFSLSSLPVEPSQAAVIYAARTALGPRAWEPVRRVLAGLLLLRQEPILTLMPSAIVIR